MRVREMVLRAAEGESLGPRGGLRVVQLEVTKDGERERAILYYGESPELDPSDLVSRVFHGQDIPAWVRSLMVAVLTLGEDG